jgi:thiamine pyridinylase
MKDINPENRIKIGMYPYIPDSSKDGFLSLKNGLERLFLESNPGYAIEVTFTYPNTIYDPLNICTWLEDGMFNVIAIDALLLEAVDRECTLTAWKNLNTKDIHLAALTSATLNGKLLGVPHYMCSYFVFSKYPQIQEIQTFPQLVEFLDSLNTKSINIMHSNLLDNYSASATYLTSLHNSGKEIEFFLDDRNIHQDIAEKLKLFARQCSNNNINLCLDAYTDIDINNNFLNGNADSMVGFFESLSSLLMDDVQNEDIYFTNLNFGDDPSTMLMFTDVFVKTIQCDEKCEKIANMFAEFILKPEILSYITMGQDGNNVPRYVIPATFSAFKQPEVRANKFYNKVEPMIFNAASMPNAGIPEIRKDWYGSIIGLAAQEDSLNN